MNEEDKKDLELFGRQLRAQRKLLRYNIRQIACEAQIDPRTLGNIERGQHWPSLVTYFRLCKTLEMPTRPPFSPFL